MFGSFSAVAALLFNCFNLILAVVVVVLIIIVTTGNVIIFGNKAG